MESVSDLVIQEANRWFIKRILSKSGLREVEPHFTKIIKKEISFENLKNEGIYVPECNLRNYIAFRTEFHFVPLIDGRQIWFGDPGTDIFVSGIVILPREFSRKIRFIYSIKMLLNNYPEVYDFPMFSFPIKRINLLNGDIFKVLREDFGLFKCFLKDLKKKFPKDQKILKPT